MKKNKMMRLAALLLVLVLMTSSVVGGTFAKYVTEANSEDEARVAVWGINADATEMDLFKAAYTSPVGQTVKSRNDKDVIAPGTTGSSAFKVLVHEDMAPEVTYDLVVSLEGTTISEEIKNNKHIMWRINYYDQNTKDAKPGVWTTWDGMLNQILNYASGGTPYQEGVYEVNTHRSQPGDKIYGTLENGIGVIEWCWTFDDSTAEADFGGKAVTGATYEVDGVVGSAADGKLTQDEYDTYMGNLAVTEDLIAKLVITITATQVD